MSAPPPNSNQSMNNSYSSSSTSSSPPPLDVSQVGMKRKVSDESSSSSVGVISHSGAADLSSTNPIGEMEISLSGISKRIRALPPIMAESSPPMSHGSLLHQLTDPDSYPSSHTSRLASHYTVRQTSNQLKEQEAAVRECMKSGLNIMTPDSKGRIPLVSMCLLIRDGHLPLSCFTIVLESQAQMMDLSVVNDLIDPQLIDAPPTGPNRLLYWMIASQKTFGTNSTVTAFVTALMKHPDLLIQLDRSTILEALEYQSYDESLPILPWSHLPSQFEQATIQAFQTLVKPLVQIHLIHYLAELTLAYLGGSRSQSNNDELLEIDRTRIENSAVHPFNLIR